LRQTNHRGLHRTPREQTHGSIFSSLAVKLSIIVPVVAVGASVAGFTLYSGFSSASPAPAVHAAATAADDADPNPDCTLTVPENPLSANGLATPYLLSATDPKGGQCDEANTGQSAFVEATVINPANGALSVYRPLVIDKGAVPAAPEVVPALPKNAVVGLWFGFNGDNLTLHPHGNSLAAGNCVNGAHNSIFGQFAFCNAANFFTSANAAVRKGQIKIPALAMAKDGLPCETTRDFGMIDQDQSDNVISAYLVLPNGKVAQDNAKNEARLKDSTTLVNGSDNLLLDSFIDPALGCTPFQAPDLTNPGAKVSSLALNELFAAARQKAPIALVPTNDPMVLVDGKLNVTKTNLYRSGVNMAPLHDVNSTPKSYCQDTLDVGAKRIQQDKNLTIGAPSPDTGAANNLYTFLASRWSESLTNLGCDKLIKVGNPVTLTTDADGVVTDAVFAKKCAAVPVHDHRSTPNGDSAAAARAPHKPKKY
jgi:hypothetical protein